MILFNLDATLECGQCFRWRKVNGIWYGCIEDDIIKIVTRGTTIQIYTDLPDWKIRQYFDLERDLDQIYDQIKKDSTIKTAIERYKGMRLLRQNPWETLISFMLTVNTGISHTRGMVTRLCNRMGKRMEYEGILFSSFPTPQQFTEASDTTLSDSGLGFRAKNIREVSRMVYEGELDLDLEHLSYNKMIDYLSEIPGVGKKVADCIALFAFGRYEAFPVDVNIKQVLVEFYKPLFKFEIKQKVTKKQYDLMAGTMREYFGPYAGYAGEYLFHYYRNRKTAPQFSMDLFLNKNQQNINIGSK